MKLKFREGQQFCFNCGSEFAPQVGQQVEVGQEVIVSCPILECNRGSWATVVALDEEFEED